MQPTSSPSCPICGHPVLRPDQDTCAECGLVWDDWIDRNAPKLAMGRLTWWMLLVVFPLVFTLPPLLTARGAVMGARTFEASYLLTIPGFAGICFLGIYYARAVGWRLARRLRRTPHQSEGSRPPSILWFILGWVLLTSALILIYFLMIRLGFYWFVHPLRPVLPGGTMPGIG